ncbi:DsbA family protein [Patescibacteria group bacterium]|nr:DsbA family protein [Patescibacteria group bacterium]
MSQEKIHSDNTNKSCLKGGKLAISLSIVALLTSITAIGMQFPSIGGKLLQSNLLQGDFLAEQIQDGIDKYVKKMEEPTQPEQPQEIKIKALQSGDHIRGEKDAVITLIEYSDYECSYCARFHATAKELIEKNEGKVNWVYRHFPLDMHDPLATLEAKAAEVAGELGGNEIFWAYSDALYGNEYKSDTKEDLVAIAHELGLDTARFEAMLVSDKFDAKVAGQKQEAIDANINGTPGNIIMNNKTGEYQVIPGALPLAEMQKVIDQML